MPDIKDVKKKIDNLNTTLKTVKTAEKITRFGLGVADKLTDGQVEVKLTEIQEKIDESFGEKVEDFIDKVQEKMDNAFGEKIEQKLGEVDKIIDEKAGKKIDEVLLKGEEFLKQDRETKTQAIKDLGKKTAEKSSQLMEGLKNKGQQAIESIKKKKASNTESID